MREPRTPTGRLIDMLRAFTTLVSLVSLVALASCGGSSGDIGEITPLDELTETYGCGHGFWVGNPEQTTALRFQYLGDDGQAPDANLPSDEWQVQLIDGQDLYANWCDDVIEPNEPEPLVVRTLEVIRGSLDVIGEPPAPFEGGSLTLEATGLALETPDGEIIELGDIEIENPSYGFLAG